MNPVVTKHEKFVLSRNYQYQGDSSNPNEAWRMCQSSTLEMWLEGAFPGIISKNTKLHGRQFDDFYRETLENLNPKYDTTDQMSQLATLDFFMKSAKVPFRAEFRTNGTWQMMIDNIEAGYGQPSGVLHKGHVSAPTGGGHWVFPVGYAEHGEKLVVHDPAGSMKLVEGGYSEGTSTNGKYAVYSRKNFEPRWRVNGSGGWFYKFVPHVWK